MVLRLALLTFAASYLAAEPLPEVKDWGSVRITMSREAGFCACASYHVQVRGGLVAFYGQSGVLLKGEHFAPIMRSEVEELLQEFRRIDFTSYSGSYTGVLDASVYTVSIAFDGHPELSVTSQSGSSNPEGLRELQDAIDRIAKTARWVHGNDETVESLLLEKYPIDSGIVDWALSRYDAKSSSKLRAAAATDPALAKRIEEFDLRRGRR